LKGIGMRPQQSIIGIFFLIVVIEAFANGPVASMPKSAFPPDQQKGSENASNTESDSRKPAVLAAGTTITVRLSSAVGSEISKTGDHFTASVAYPVTTGNTVVISKNADVLGTVLEAQAKGKLKGEARLRLALTKITIKGQNYLVATREIATTEKGKGKRTAATTGGGAAGGALIGGIAGGGKGAGVGALVGAGAGLIGGAFTGNKQIELPVESILSFQLSKPLTLK
jgi:hypothetical protein